MSNSELFRAKNKQQMLKVVLTDKRAVFHTLLFYDIATQRELTNDTGTPLAKLCGTDRVYTIANRNDCVTIIEQCVAPNLSKYSISFNLLWQFT